MPIFVLLRCSFRGKRNCNELNISQPAWHCLPCPSLTSHTGSDGQAAAGVGVLTPSFPARHCTEPLPAMELPGVCVRVCVCARVWVCVCRWVYCIWVWAYVFVGMSVLSTCSRMCVCQGLCAWLFMLALPKLPDQNKCLFSLQSLFGLWTPTTIMVITAHNNDFNSRRMLAIEPVCRSSWMWCGSLAAWWPVLQAM